MQLSDFPAGQGANFFHRFVGTPQQFADFLQEELSFRRKRHTARAAMQQVYANFILEILQLPAERRLHHAELQGGLGETQRLCHSQKVSQMPHLHCSSPLCRKGMTVQATGYLAFSATLLGYRRGREPENSKL